MKKMKLAVFFAALVSVLSFSSCLDTNSESAYDGIALVTVTGDEFIGYKLYADGGGILVPTATNMKQFGDWSKVKRAQVAFKHLDEVLPEPSENTKYKVEIVSVGQLFGGTNMINGGVGIYKGYITFSPQFNYNSSSPFYFNMSYREEDIVDNEKLTLTFHYDNGESDSYNSINVLCSFPFSSELYSHFSETDSIDVVLRAMQDRGGENYVKKEVRMATKDFIAPYGY